MEIKPLNRESLPEMAQFSAIFTEYFADVFQHTPQDAPKAEDMPEVIQWYLNDTNHEDACVLLAYKNTEIAGFVVAHIDQPHKNWCVKENWFCLREIYVMPKHRKDGIAKQLVNAAEAALAHFKPTGHYLTCDSGLGFWEKMGYVNTGELLALNNSYIYIKK